LALKLLQGEALPPATYIQHVFITRDNIEDYYPLAAEQPVREERGYAGSEPGPDAMAKRVKATNG
jgi:hypothetical protein